ASNSEIDGSCDRQQAAKTQDRLRCQPSSRQRSVSRAPHLAIRRPLGIVIERRSSSSDKGSAQQNFEERQGIEAGGSHQAACASRNQDQEQYFGLRETDEVHQPGRQVGPRGVNPFYWGPQPLTIRPHQA